MFGFESGIDITNDTQVLYRKNVVIKNIIFVSNLIFTLIFALLSIGEHSNIVLMIILFPVTFLVNMGLKKTINKNPNDITTQRIASYVACFYMLLLSIVIYFKLKWGTLVYLQECGYILIYYSLAVCSFYQDKKLLKFIYQWVLVGVTILHFTVTYDVIHWKESNDLASFVTTFFSSEVFRDILVRTILLGIFMLVLYCIVSMSGYMQEERRKELMKRREVQEDFTNVVTKIFDATLDTSLRSQEDKANIMLVSKMTEELAASMNFTPEESQELKLLSTIHIEREVNFSGPSSANEDEKFEYLKEQTNLGSIIVSRLQLERKCERMIRATFEKSSTDQFIEKMKCIQNDRNGQIILICELYVTMRSEKTYKRPYTHKKTMEYMLEQFRVYFDPVIFERFERFQDKFEEIYDENGGETDEEY